MLVTALGPVGVGVEDDVEVLESTKFDNVELGADFEEAEAPAKGDVNFNLKKSPPISV